MGSAREGLFHLLHLGEKTLASQEESLAILSIAVSFYSSRKYCQRASYLFWRSCYICQEEANLSQILASPGEGPPCLSVGGVWPDSSSHPAELKWAGIESAQGNCTQSLLS